MSPPGRGPSKGLRSVRFDSELHGRVLVVCLFCTREPSCSHLAPCGLFVSAPGTRHAFAFGGMPPKFFRWTHCGTSSNGAAGMGLVCGGARCGAGQKLLPIPAMAGLLRWFVIGIFADFALGADNFA